MVFLLASVNLDYGLLISNHNVPLSPASSQFLYFKSYGSLARFGKWTLPGTSGTMSFPDLGVEFASGCTNFAHAKHQLCPACRHSPENAHLIADQLSILGTEEREDADGQGLEIMYVVQCKDPADASQVVELLLPRQEIRKDLLLSFERGLLPQKTDHGNKKVAKAKGSRQKARWLRKTDGPCSRVLQAKKPGAKKMARPPAKKVAVPNLTECTVDKDTHRRRRTTGGILTCVLSCGLLADFIEMWRGEQLELVYVFLLQFFKDMQKRGVSISCVAYDNACKLWKTVQEKKDSRPPWSTRFAEIGLVLDHFHKRNHTWCLANLPQTNPDAPENVKLLKNKNTEACEQLNSWITARTKSSLEMPPGRFTIYWRTLFQQHNVWLEAEADCLRKRFAKGKMQHDPDKTRGFENGQMSDQEPPSLSACSSLTDHSSDEPHIRQGFLTHEGPFSPRLTFQRELCFVTCPA